MRFDCFGGVLRLSLWSNVLRSYARAAVRVRWGMTLMTHQKGPPSKQTHDQQQQREKQVRVGRARKHCPQQSNTSRSTRPPSTSSLTPRTNKTSLGSIVRPPAQLTGNHQGGDGAGGGFCDPERWSRLRKASRHIRRRMLSWLTPRCTARSIVMTGLRF